MARKTPAPITDSAPAPEQTLPEVETPAPAPEVFREPREIAPPSLMEQRSRTPRPTL